MSEHTDVVRLETSGALFTSRHTLMRRAGGSAAKASADIRQKFMLCVVLAAVRWVGVSRIFFAL
ncbi:hypothetical protein ACMFFK_08420 [Serratia marcescens]|uniref:hypothetical protein n=1 Tax=Serratia TaxID=613 RepID=UPI0010572751|nr:MULTISPECIES: hypothetical protein [Serratia]MBH2553804.1 hypothetical protein [Serratia ureilytica]MBH2978167.1 hypothetical protein [Serratia marcescens]MBH3266270.1 hypothetical protein [Serratia ureilytica]MBN5326820.1 hypothetical protein [Serratia marcescens]MBN5347813.1 hypothetical protein [Serratia marcescens]